MLIGVTETKKTEQRPAILPIASRLLFNSDNRFILEDHIDLSDCIAEKYQKEIAVTFQNEHPSEKVIIDYSEWR